MVVPELQKRGLFRTEYEGSTLRDHLGVPRPENQHVGTNQWSQVPYRLAEAAE
jgi:hypothetical protein